VNVQGVPCVTGQSRPHFVDSTGNGSASPHADHGVQDDFLSGPVSIDEKPAASIDPSIPLTRTLPAPLQPDASVAQWLDRIAMSQIKGG
jgi:hypothetical protein